MAKVRRKNKSKSSKGELRVAELLTENGYSYTAQYVYGDLYGIGGANLRFDFAVLNSRGGVSWLIEYQGEQHYRPIKFFGGLKGHIKQQIHDNMKREYCEFFEIPLVEIPYTKLNNMTIEDLLPNQGGTNEDN